MKRTSIDYSIIIEFEKKIKTNISITHCTIQDYSPLNESQCYKIVLTEADISRIFLCQAPNIIDHTKNRSSRLQDTMESAKEVIKERAPDTNSILDLRASDHLSPIFITPNLDMANLVAIDGNHRLMAHFLAYRNIDGVHAYAYVHPNTTKFPWYPDNAK